MAPVQAPEVEFADWVRTPVDRFILHSLEQSGLQPAAPVDKRRLVRRVTFDLTGLPPTTAELDAFLGDERPDAFARVVQRLLSSPHYGERWARHWLDLVRYADASGDDPGDTLSGAWLYRDYVIRALNDDLPFDTFVTEHIAGDLLDEPRLTGPENSNASLIATAFFRFGEVQPSPVDPREEQAARIENQIDVLSKAFLGLTIACARCHDHKFDAVSQADYYALAGCLLSTRPDSSFIDHTSECQTAAAELQVLDGRFERVAVAATARRLSPKLSRLSERLLSTLGDAAARRTAEAWRLISRDHREWQLDGLLYPWLVLGKYRRRAPHEFTAARHELVQRLRSSPRDADEWREDSVRFNAAEYARWLPSGGAFSSSALGFANVLRADAGKPVERVVARDGIDSGRLSARLQGHIRSPTFRLRRPFVWIHAGGSHASVNIIIDGYDRLRFPFYNLLTISLDGAPEWWRFDVGAWLGHDAYIEISDPGIGYAICDEVVFNDGAYPLRASDLVLNMIDDPRIVRIEVLAAAYRSMFERAVSAWSEESFSSEANARDCCAAVNWLLSHEDFLDEPTDAGAEAERDALDQGSATAECAGFAAERTAREERLAQSRVAVTVTDGDGRNASVAVGPDPKQPLDEVPRGVVDALDSPPSALPQKGSGRLGLAAAMLASPLVPRVIVNRVWQHHFGRGLVATPDDFGNNGDSPTHPELLDFLALRFVGHGWSLKDLHRLILMSSTYQMSCAISPASDIDPENRLWHRRERRRLEAEAVRDAILAVSGGLRGEMFGESVYPSVELSAAPSRNASGSSDVDGRRSIYLSVARNSPSAVLRAFDFPVPSTTVGRRNVSSSAAQALVLLNNTFVVDEAERWARNLLRDVPTGDEQRVRRVFLTAFARPPDEFELRESLRFIAARTRDAAVAAGDHTAWADFCHVIFNSSEFLYVE